MPRDIREILKRIIAIIPEDSHGDAIRRLEAVRHDAKYTAPERMCELWERATDVLESSIGSPTLDGPSAWRHQIQEIFNATEHS